MPIAVLEITLLKDTSKNARPQDGITTSSYPASVSNSCCRCKKKIKALRFTRGVVD